MKKALKYRISIQFNNLFVRQGLNRVKTASGYESDYNIFLEEAQKSAFADQHSIVDSYVTGFAVKDLPLGAEVSFSVNDLMFRAKGPLVNAELVGVFATVGQTIEDRYGHAVEVDSDINGKVYVPPIPGPLADIQKGFNTIKWQATHP